MNLLFGEVGLQGVELSSPHSSDSCYFLHISIFGPIYSFLNTKRSNMCSSLSSGSGSSFPGQQEYHPLPLSGSSRIFSSEKDGTFVLEKGIWDKKKSL